MMTHHLQRLETQAGRPRYHRPALNRPDDPNTLRMLALMGGHERIGLALLGNSVPPSRPKGPDRRSAQSDRAYFRRRWREERDAAVEAAGVEAREAHEQLAELYARSSGAAAARRDRSIEGRANADRMAPVRRRERQDALLDEALKGTFPASDPVSVAFIR